MQVNPAWLRAHSSAPRLRLHHLVQVLQLRRRQKIRNPYSSSIVTAIWKNSTQSKKIPKNPLPWKRKKEKTRGVEREKQNKILSLRFRQQNWKKKETPKIFFFSLYKETNSAKFFSGSFLLPRLRRNSVKLIFCFLIVAPLLSASKNSFFVIALGIEPKRKSIFPSFFLSNHFQKKSSKKNKQQKWFFFKLK